MELGACWSSRDAKHEPQTRDTGGARHGRWARRRAGQGRAGPSSSGSVSCLTLMFCRLRPLQREFMCPPLPLTALVPRVLAPRQQTDECERCLPYACTERCTQACQAEHRGQCVGCAAWRGGQDVRCHAAGGAKLERSRRDPRRRGARPGPTPCRDGAYAPTLAPVRPCACSIHPHILILLILAASTSSDGSNLHLTRSPRDLLARTGPSGWDCTICFQHAAPTRRIGREDWGKELYGAECRMRRGFFPNRVSVVLVWALIELINDQL